MYKCQTIKMQQHNLVIKKWNWLMNLLFISILIASCALKRENTTPLPEIIYPILTEYPVSCSIRALEVVDENTIWFGGNKGMYGYTTDGGAQWHIDSIAINGKLLEFRAIAITSKSIFLLNVGSPAYLLKSDDKGASWNTVYQENHPDIFYDCMQFWDDDNGIAVGDPTDGCLSVIITEDGGNHWNKIDCGMLPATVEGEAAFAASNTNISVLGNHAWIASGGKKARIFHSPDRGKSWQVHNTPVQQGGTMTGIFSMDFYDESTGIIFGGDWENQGDNTGNKAITHDGGTSWNLLTEGTGPGYRSCVQFIHGSEGKGIFAVGIPGISYSGNGGQTWQEIDKPDFYTIRFTPSGKAAWLAGKNKLAKMMF
jgi:photosystem II stability/assembly factor-like uncharacterized protein